MPSGAQPEVRRRRLGLGEVEQLAAMGSGSGGISVDNFLDAAGTHLEVRLLDSAALTEAALRRDVRELRPEAPRPAPPTPLHTHTHARARAVALTHHLFYTQDVAAATNNGTEMPTLVAMCGIAVAALMEAGYSEAEAQVRGIEMAPALVVQVTASQNGAPSGAGGEMGEAASPSASPSPSHQGASAESANEGRSALHAGLHVHVHVRVHVLRMCAVLCMC